MSNAETTPKNLEVLHAVVVDHGRRLGRAEERLDMHDSALTTLGSQMGRVESAVTALDKKFDAFHGEWKTVRKWQREMLEKALTESCTLANRFIERMTPLPLTAIIITGMLLGAGVAWNFNVVDWFDLAVGRNAAAEHDHSPRQPRAGAGVPTEAPLP